jgi:hypothetical protein
MCVCTAVYRVCTTWPQLRLRLAWYPGAVAWYLVQSMRAQNLFSWGDVGM